MIFGFKDHNDLDGNFTKEMVVYTTNKKHFLVDYLCCRPDQRHFTLKLCTFFVESRNRQ